MSSKGPARGITMNTIQLPHYWRRVFATRLCNSSCDSVVPVHSLFGTRTALTSFGNGSNFITLGKEVSHVFANTLMLIVGYGLIVMPLLLIARPIRRLHPY